MTGIEVCRSAARARLARCRSCNALPPAFADPAVQLYATRGAGAVTALAFHPAKAQLASGSRDTNIIVWDVLSESGMFRLRGHTDQVALALLGQGHRSVPSACRRRPSSQSTFTEYPSPWSLCVCYICAATLAWLRAAWSKSPCLTALAVPLSRGRRVLARGPAGSVACR